ncbi:MAG: ZIP family metal transporter [Parvularculaceae bacterium]|nr:ZIP family metal transporter [Parvularculaceae bacterium]
MTTLGWILSACLLGGVLSVAAAAAVALRADPSRVPMLISYAVGALLGAVFLEILPHAFDSVTSARSLGATILAGILVFFLLEKLVLWRHQHAPQWGETGRNELAHGHEHDHGRSGMMIMIGDTVHNFVDGVLIAAAFMADVQLGIVTALAIIAHEIPSEVGDFVILLHSGYSQRQALAVNLVSSLAMLAGGLLGYTALLAVQGWIPSLLGFVAASMIYVAVADLIPGLHRRPELRATAQQVLLIGLGIATIYTVRALTGHAH